MKHRPFFPFLLGLLVLGAVVSHKHRMLESGTDRPQRPIPPMIVELHRRLHAQDQGTVL